MLTFLLIAHVIIGLVGVIGSYIVVTQLLKRNMSLGWLRASSIIAFASYLISWLTGGYYYVVRYGSEVKPIIKGGDYAWAHSIVTETKEHVFLFLPFLAFITVVVALFLGDELKENAPLRRALIGVSVVTFVIGALIALAGIIMSGAVR